MAGVVLDHWRVATSEGTDFNVFPDGCRDVIWQQGPGRAPVWRISPLDCSARRIKGEAGVRLIGFRLAPGAVLAPEVTRVLDPEAPDEAVATISALAAVPLDLAEILCTCAAHPERDVQQLAHALGVSVRTLQRITAAATGQGPLFWLRLCRVRQALATAAAGLPLAYAACDVGFADQAHFTREARAFHGDSPARLLARPSVMAAILAPGLGPMAVV